MTTTLKLLVPALALILVTTAAHAQPTVNLTSPANNSLHTPGSNIALSATATAPSGYTISKVEFFRGTTLIGTDTSSPYSFNWTNVAQGNYTLTAKVTAIKKNNPNQVATSSPRDIIVTVSPSLTLLSPQDGAVMPSAQIALSANATDSDGSIANVRFYYEEKYGADYGEVVLTQAPYTTNLPVQPNCCDDGLGVYDYYITAETTDNQGAKVTLPRVLVTVPRLGIISPAPNATFTAPANISIQLSVINADGLASSVGVYAGSTPIGTATSPTYTVNWTGVPAGTYSITAAIFQAVSAPVSITVNPGLATLYFIEVDHLNTPRHIENQSQQAVWTWDQHEPFGVNVPNENPLGLGAFEFSLRFPGQYLDKETNLHYNEFRDCYDPAIGRYCQPDPAGVVLLGHIGSRNLGTLGLAHPELAEVLFSNEPRYNHSYSYADNSPTMLSDRRGLIPGDSDPFGINECQVAGCVLTIGPLGGFCYYRCSPTQEFRVPALPLAPNCPKFATRRDLSPRSWGMSY